MALGPEECIINGVTDAMLILLPALVANPTPVLVKGKRPIDSGMMWIDGRRLLGDGKTWEGFIAGIISGAVIGFLLWRLLSIDLTILHALLIALGALLGDIAGSFIKRRLSLPRGAPAPLLDQLDFYVGAVAASILAGCSWTLNAFLVTAIIVIIIHVTANIAAYLVGLKKEPW